MSKLFEFRLLYFLNICVRRYCVKNSSKCLAGIGRVDGETAKCHTLMLCSCFYDDGKSRVDTKFKCDKSEEIGRGNAETDLNAEKIEFETCDYDNCDESRFKTNNINLDISKSNFKTKKVNIVFDDTKLVSKKTNFETSKSKVEIKKNNLETKNTNFETKKTNLDFKKFIKTEYSFENPDQITILNNLIENDETREAFHLLQNLSKLKIPVHFSTMNKLSEKMLKTCSITEMQYIKQETARSHPRMYILNYEMNHHMAQALFHAGHELKALKLLDKLMAKYSDRREIVEVVGDILALVPGSSEEVQKMYSKWVCSVSQRNGLEQSAFHLWSSFFKSRCHFQNMLASKMLLWQPAIVLGDCSRLSALVDEARVESDVELLHKMIEICLSYQNKFELKEVLLNAMSALLMDYCISDNCAAADEVFLYSQSQKVKLSRTALVVYSKLLSDLNKPTPLGVLAFKYGFEPIKERYSSKYVKHKNTVLNIKKILQPDEPKRDKKAPKPPKYHF